MDIAISFVELPSYCCRHDIHVFYRFYSAFIKKEWCFGETAKCVTDVILRLIKLL